ncbi:SIMPL domain-containing protein [Metabacillus fastidiosus]|uniref:SIMPL domain-containing protein n=1 Tax=Metabacillus fastidiosus TaxID=1458 RepID=UPI002E1EDA3A|nr:SIMPL domain-containing protein [Metabacillus fastidiosus]MED4452220.1 SIMPL domain-containing protein [Metabacillus fastidiosus]
MSSFPNYHTRNRADVRLQHTMRVEGTARIKIMPDLAIINVGIMTENEQVNAAQQENAVRSNQVIQTLKNAGISDNDIQTISYTVQPKYDYVEGASVFKGYRVEHILEVTIRDIQKIGEVYDAAVSSGANVISSLQFKLSNEDVYYKKALQLALENAKEKAKALGQQMGTAVLPIPINIKEEGSPVPFQAKAATFMAQEQAATPIQRREVEIEAKVAATFQY